MLIFYLLCGATGNIFGAVCDSNGALFVGCTPACFAMFSGLFACLMVNWKALDRVQHVRCPLIFAFVMITLLLLLNSTSVQNTGNNYHTNQVYANWGGYLCGLFLGLIMMPRLRPQASYVGSYEKLCMKMGLAWLVIYWSILFSCYWTVYQPPCYYFKSN